MSDQKPRQPITSYFFIFFLIIGSILFFASFIYGTDSGLFSGLRQTASGVILVGVGEWINHPLQKSVTVKDKENFVFQKILHRRRNPSGLGNLIEISGLLVFFSGLADFF